MTRPTHDELDELEYDLDLTIQGEGLLKIKPGLYSDSLRALRSLRAELAEARERAEKERDRADDLEGWNASIVDYVNTHLRESGADKLQVDSWEPQELKHAIGNLVYALRERAERAERDMARLDWLETRKREHHAWLCSKIGPPDLTTEPCGYILNSYQHFTARAAIDAARGEKP